MTMTRTTKNLHTEILSTRSDFTGQVTAEFASPREIAKRGGRVRMTAAEYIAFRMGRGPMHTCRIDNAIETRTDRLMAHRRGKPVRVA